MRRRALVGWGAGLAALAFAGTAEAQTRSKGPLTLSIAGPARLVFEHRRQACDAEDYPDVPARAFRNAQGQMVLVDSHWRTRNLSGPSLFALKRDCRVAFQGGDNGDPARRNDRLWIASPWSADGRTVHALVHSEYQGHRHPRRCPSGRYMECWYNTITYARSDDGGLSYRFDRTPPAIVAGVPYRYDPAAKRHIGFFNPSNIVRHAGAFYVLVFTEGAGFQPRGNCLLRATDLARPDSWRGWSGTSFTTRFVDPYRAAGFDPADHVCAPVSRATLNWGVVSLVKHLPSGRFAALMIGDTEIAGRGRRRAILASTSTDLLHWSEPQLVREVSRLDGADCGRAEAPLVYPSLIDPGSTDRNFGTTGDQAYLLVTRMRVRSQGGQCQIGNDRDLLAFPVKLSTQPRVPQ